MPQNDLGAAGRAYYDVRLGHSFKAFSKANGSPAKFSGQILRALKVAVRDQDRAGALFGEVTHAGLAHLARADDHHGFRRKIFVEDALGQLDRDAPDRSGPAANISLRTNFLRDLECSLKKAI